MKIHPLNTDIPKPERFTYPFCYEPHPLAVLAAEEVKRELSKMHLTEGKMFGVLVVEGGFLAAYSGLLEGRNDWEYFVPPVFDAQQPDGHFKQTEREISLLSHTSPLTAKKMSQDLQLWLFHQYQFLNARSETKDLIDVWQAYHCSPRIRKRYPLPPGGTGDCCAPKLLQYAYQHGLRPICMAEFWWGPSPKSEVRHHGQFYPACRGKCKPVLTWMLQGLDVDPNPEEAGFPHLVPEIIYEDEAMAVVNKPSGLLSVPGRAEDYSVATWAREKWSDAIPAHRLDMWTSGLLVIAKTKEVYTNLQEQFVKRTVRKRYIAVLDGVPSQQEGRIELPLLSDPLNRPRQVVDFKRGKSSVTEYKCMAVANSHTLIALYPHTGRTHQLRVHCAHKDGLGCPILGDELYGRKESADRLCLHSDRLELIHPVTGQQMQFELPYPFGNLIPYNNK
ncbi:MAG: RluA family pseudouridine synthase [Prevotella sp.]|nr:RluA family pseudouridine synthase [Prevotella sp.]